MAAALLKHRSAGRVEVRSAGTAPADSVNSAVIAVMNEIGIDLVADGAHPKRLTDEAVETSDVVITMGCGDECPFIPGIEYLDWDLPDPAGQSVDVVRDIRDRIETLVVDLLERLAPEVVGPEK